MSFFRDRLRFFRFATIAFLFIGILLFSWTIGTMFAGWMGDSSAEKSANAVNNYGKEAFFDEYMRFENSIYDYINDSIYEYIITSDLEAKDLPKSELIEGFFNHGMSKKWKKNGISEEIDLKVVELGNHVLRKIAVFEAKKKAHFSFGLMQRINKLRLNISMKVLVDRKKSEIFIDSLENDVGKVVTLKTYANFFAPSEKEEVKKFLLNQQKWIEGVDPDFLPNIDLLLFYANPVGQKLPDYFTGLLSTKGAPLGFDNFSGKYLLIDFWASWCLPCLEELPYLKEMYNTFSPKYFDIIAVSLDSDKVAFNKVLNHYNLDWVQYFDGKSFSSGLVNKYFVTKLPTKYFIGPDRTIILANASAEEILLWLKEELSSEIGKEFRKKQKESVKKTEGQIRDDLLKNKEAQLKEKKSLIDKK